MHIEPLCLYREAPPERGTFFQASYERVGNLSFQLVKRSERANKCVLWLYIFVAFWGD